MNKHFKAGLCPFFKNQLDDEYSTLAKVVQVNRDSYIIITEEDELRAKLPGKLIGQSLKPAVGDWVLIKYNPMANFALIEKILNRKNSLGRKSAGEYSEQILGSNIDLALIIFSLNSNLNIRRLERYLAQVRDNKIKPLIVLTKSDLVSKETTEQTIAKYKEVAKTNDVIALSSLKDEGMDKLKQYLSLGKTGILIGSSGVGKSTIVNYLLGEEVQLVQGIREDDQKGRHTTVTRSLHFLDNGSLLMDTPGMRGLGLWLSSEGLDNSFTDVTSLMSQCKFSNCSHQEDVGCALNEALDNGTLDEERFQSYLKLKKEERFQAVRRSQKLMKLEKEKWAKLTQNAKEKQKYNL